MSSQPLFDEYSIVAMHGGLRGDASPYNIFRKVNSSVVLPVLVNNTNRDIQNVLIYQVHTLMCIIHGLYLTCNNYFLYHVLFINVA